MEGIGQAPELTDVGRDDRRVCSHMIGCPPTALWQDGIVGTPPRHLCEKREIHGVTKRYQCFEPLGTIGPRVHFCRQIAQHRTHVRRIMKCSIDVKYRCGILTPLFWLAWRSLTRLNTV